RRAAGRRARPHPPPRGGRRRLGGATVSPPTLFTIGYERLMPLELAAELRQAGVQRVIDERFRPQSRRAGMSKTRLGELLRDHGIAYEHRRELGTPPHIRPLFHQGRLDEARAAYTQHLHDEAPEALGELAE